MRRFRVVASVVRAIVRMKLLASKYQKQDVTQYKAAFAYLCDEGSTLSAEKLVETLRSFSLNADAIGNRRSNYNYQQFYAMMSDDGDRTLRRRSVLSSQVTIKRAVDMFAVNKVLEAAREPSDTESEISQTDLDPTPKNIAGILESARTWINEDLKFTKTDTKSQKLVKPRTRELWESKHEPAVIRRTENKTAFTSSTPRSCFEGPKNPHVTPRTARKPVEKLSPIRMERRPRLPDFVRNRDPVLD
jgi:hypothetical protein